MSTIEIVATIFGLISVYLTVKENIWCWPTGLIMVFLYIFIFFDAKLYSDMGLQIIYVFMQIYGWYYWKNGDKENENLHVSRLKKSSILIWSLIAVLGTILLGFTMNRYTDASYPYADAFAAVVSLIAQWFLGKKILESWVLWIIVDLVSIILYGLKGLYLTQGLYLVFLILAISGLIKWNKSHQKKAKAA